jgi:hypothetical protein
MAKSKRPTVSSPSRKRDPPKTAEASEASFRLLFINHPEVD